VRELRTSSQAGPVAIRGVGGSGTRLVADIVLELGFYLGADLNYERDNLWFTLLLKRPEWYAKERAGDSTGIHVALRLFERVMIGGRRPSMAELRLMAYSRNQFQLHNWGSLFGVEPPASSELLPRASLRYWTRSNLRAVELGESLLGPRFLLLNYDGLCRDPETGVDSLLAFLGCSVSAAKRGRLVSLPRRAPERRDREMAPVEEEDARALSRLGFDPVEEAL
jgi:hypothetical protein